MHDGTCQVPAGHRELGVQELGNGLFLRGLPHESTVRGHRGVLRFPYIIFAQWNNTLAGCLMSLPCGSCRISCGLHISSSHGGTSSLSSVPCRRIGSPLRCVPLNVGLKAVGQSGALQAMLVDDISSYLIYEQARFIPMMPYVLMSYVGSGTCSCEAVSL